MGGGEDLVDIVERMALDEGGQGDFPVQPRDRAAAGYSSSGHPQFPSTGRGTHQVRETQLHLVHGEADDRQRRPGMKQPEGGVLFPRRSGALEDLPSGVGQPLSLREFPDRLLEIATLTSRTLTVNGSAVAAMASSFSGSTSRAATVAPKARAICTAYPPTPPTPTTTGNRRADPRLHHRLVWVVTASATTERSGSARPAAASRTSSRGTVRATGRGCGCGTRPGYRSPASVAGGRSWPCPEVHSSHSPQGMTAG